MVADSGRPHVLATDLREVALVAVASRLCVVAIAVLSDLLLPDHLAQGALQAPFETGCAAAPLLRAFTRWDAAHFLRVAQHGWRDDWNYAFFPLYPLLLRWLSGASQHLPLIARLCEQERMVLGGVLLSNASFVLAACCLCANAQPRHAVAPQPLATQRRFTREDTSHRSPRHRRYALGAEVLRDRRLARGGALLFCCSPASVFFSSLYTESPFALATFGGFLPSLLNLLF